jgi:hypothetical protein
MVWYIMISHTAPPNPHSLQGAGATATVSGSVAEGNGRTGLGALDGGRLRLGTNTIRPHPEVARAVPRLQT